MTVARPRLAFMVVTTTSWSLHISVLDEPLCFEPFAYNLSHWIAGSSQMHKRANILAFHVYLS